MIGEGECVECVGKGWDSVFSEMFVGLFYTFFIYSFKWFYRSKNSLIKLYILL